MTFNQGENVYAVGGDGMRWAQVSVVTTHEGADLIGNILMELGAAGTEIDDPSLVNEYIDAGLWDYTDLPRAEDTDTVTVRAYLPEDARLEGSLLSLAERIEGLRRVNAPIGAGTISHTFVADEDWAETWKAYIHTEKIGQRIVVQPHVGGIHADGGRDRHRPRPWCGLRHGGTCNDCDVSALAGTSRMSADAHL